MPQRLFSQQRFPLVSMPSSRGSRTDVPIDLAESSNIERLVEERGYRGQNVFLAYARNEEASYLSQADLIILGTIESENPRELDGLGIYTFFTLRIERCLKGACPTDMVEFGVWGGTAGERTRWISLAPRFTVGERAIVLLERSPSGREPPGLYALSEKHRYLVEDEIVTRKGLALAEFIEKVEEFVAARDLRSMFDAAEVVVRGTIRGTEQIEELETQRRIGAWEHRTDVVSLNVVEVLKIPEDAPADLEVFIPHLEAIRRFDRPRLAVDDEVLLFLVRRGDSGYRILGNASGVYERGTGASLEGEAIWAETISRARAIASARN